MSERDETPNQAVSKVLFGFGKWESNCKDTHTIDWTGYTLLDER